MPNLVLPLKEIRINKLSKDVALLILVTEFPKKVPISVEKTHEFTTMMRPDEAEEMAKNLLLIHAFEDIPIIRKDIQF